MKLLEKYIVSLTNLYGIVSVEKVYQVYNAQNKDIISAKDVIPFLENPPMYIRTEGKLFVHEETYYEEESPKELFKDRVTMPYYVPEKDELLKYVEDEYFEKNSYYQDIYKRLTNYFLDGNKELAEDITDEIRNYLTYESSDFLGALDILDAYDVAFEENSEASKLTQLIADYAVNIPKREYNAYSLTEVNALMREYNGIRRTNKLELTILEKYIVSLTNLYGRVTKEKVVEIYNSQNDDQITLSEVESYLLKDFDYFADYLVLIAYGEFVAEDLVIFEEEYEVLVNEQSGKPFYVPEQEELFNYLDANFLVPSKEYGDLLAYLTNDIYITDPRLAEIKAENIQLILEMGGGLQAALQEVIMDYEFKNKKQIEGLADAIKNLNNHTRMRTNNGLTPYELGLLSVAKKPTKLGRNEPCHCGSGKKYKKCCMKKDLQ